MESTSGHTTPPVVRRKGRTALHRLPPASSGIISLREDPGEAEYIVPRFDLPNLTKVRGGKIRSSTRWIEGPSKSYDFDFPHFDRVGKFTGTTLFGWTCDPRSYIASVVSTIAKRLERHCFRHNAPHLVLRNSERIVRVAYYYANTKDCYFWDRILFFTRNLEKYGKLLHTYLLRKLCATDNHKRFVYGHVCFQTKWLLFRAKRPRDKSANRRFHSSLFEIQKWAECIVNGDLLSEMAHAISSL